MKQNFRSALEAEFLEWFRTVYDREWLDIKNEQEDIESLNARRAFEAGARWGREGG